MPLYDVFLSHASADKPAVEQLARKLRDEGLEPFLDKWHLIPGEPWQEALEDALDQSRTCAVFLGKTLGPWQNEEMRSALESRVRDAGFRVIPVLLPGGKERGKEKLPRFLSRLTWPLRRERQGAPVGELCTVRITRASRAADRTGWGPSTVCG